MNISCKVKHFCNLLNSCRDITYKTGEYEQEESQYFNYIGGAGGTGKSRIIDAFRDVFRVKDCEKEIFITASSDFR